MARFKDIAYLESETTTLDKLHRPIVKYSKTAVYCDVKSIGQSEFYQSAVAGYKPEIKLVMKLVDLTNVTHVEYNNKLYTITRTYEVGDNVEVTLSSMVVNNGW